MYRVVSPAGRAQNLDLGMAGDHGHDTMMPNSLPMPAVATIAKAPHSVTRPAPSHGDAPPDTAATAPSIASESRDTTGTAITRVDCGAHTAVRIGKAPPMEKVAAEEIAA